MTIFAETERLVVRRPTPADFDAFLRTWADPDTLRYVPRRPDLPAFIRELLEEMERKQPGDLQPQPWFQFAVEHRDSGEVVGDLGVGFGVPGERQVELGYRIHPDHRRRGYVREAVAGIIDYLIASHGIHRFVGVAASPNIASIRVLQSLGFRQEGHFRESFLVDGEWLDDDYFALLASEWRARRG